MTEAQPHSWQGECPGCDGGRFKEYDIDSRTEDGEPIEILCGDCGGTGRQPHNWRYLTLEKSLLMDKLDAECEEAWGPVTEPSTLTKEIMDTVRHRFGRRGPDLPFITCITKEPDIE